jgi:hypothetical protein
MASKQNRFSPIGIRLINGLQQQLLKYIHGGRLRSGVAAVLTIFHPMDSARFDLS